MFEREFKVVSASFGNIDAITEEEVQYNFLPGSVSLSTENDKIEMELEWIPLLEFSFCLRKL